MMGLARCCEVDLGDGGGREMERKGGKDGPSLLRA